MAEIKNRIYRVSPTCPNCGEEHCSFDIILTAAEQKQLDEFYEREENKGKSNIELLLRTMYNAPVYAARRFHCCVCGSYYTCRVGVVKQNEVKNDRFQ